MSVGNELVVKFQATPLWCQSINPGWAKGHCEEAEDEGVCPRRPRCLWEIVSVSGLPTRIDQVLFSLDRIYIDSFPRRPRPP